MATTVRQPRLDDLTRRLLSDVGFADAGEFGEVEPHDVMGGVRTDPRLGWQEVVDLAARTAPAAGPLSGRPPEWNAFLGLTPRSIAVPMALGLFPQMVRDPMPLLASPDLRAIRPAAGAVAVAGFSGLRGWAGTTAATGTVSEACVALGILATLGHAADALAALDARSAAAPVAERAVWANQRGALLWLAGRCDEALAAWEAETGATARFNAGMALLFLGRAKEAIPALQDAVSLLPESSGWSHLGQLLLLAAQARR